MDKTLTRQDDFFRVLSRPLRDSYSRKLPRVSIRELSVCLVYRLWYLLHPHTDIRTHFIASVLHIYSGAVVQSNLELSLSNTSRVLRFRALFTLGIYELPSPDRWYHRRKKTGALSQPRIVKREIEKNYSIYGTRGWLYFETLLISPMLIGGRIIDEAKIR